MPTELEKTAVSSAQRLHESQSWLFGSTDYTSWSHTYHGIAVRRPHELIGCYTYTRVYTVIIQYNYICIINFMGCRPTARW